MEISEMDRQWFDEFARDLNLSVSDIKEIENNEKFKERLYSIFRVNRDYRRAAGDPPIYGLLMKYVNQVIFNMTQCKRDGSADDIGLYEFSPELLHKFMDYASANI